MALSLTGSEMLLLLSGSECGAYATGRLPNGSASSGDFMGETWALSKTERVKSLMF